MNPYPYPYRTSRGRKFFLLFLGAAGPRPLRGFGCGGRGARKGSKRTKGGAGPPHSKTAKGASKPGSTNDSESQEHRPHETVSLPARLADRLRLAGPGGGALAVVRRLPLDFPPVVRPVAAALVLVSRRLLLQALAGR